MFWWLKIKLTAEWIWRYFVVQFQSIIRLIRGE